MARLVATLLLLISLWNGLMASVPAFSAVTFQKSELTSLTSSDHLIQDSDQVNDGQTDCDPANCKNESCRFHQSHVGFCQFVIQKISLVDLDRGGTLLPFDQAWKLRSISISPPIKPPSTIILI